MAPKENSMSTEAPSPALAAPEGALPAPAALRGAKADRDTEEVRSALEKDKSVTPGEAVSATDWFLAEDPEEAVQETHTIELNFGVEEDKWVSWTLRPIDSDDLRRIQRQTATARKKARGDDLLVDQLGNLRVIIAGSVDPDVEAIAEQKGVTPVQLLSERFSAKPGLIAQLAGKIMALSGFDDEDIRDAVIAKN